MACAGKGMVSTFTPRKAAALVQVPIWAVTLTKPAIMPHCTVMAFVPWPAVMMASDGTVQVLISPAMAGTLKLAVVLLQTVVGPLMGPGVAGVGVSVTASWLGVLLPQLFEDETVTLPDVAPQSTEMVVVVCPERMTAPAGTFQEYEVAPGTTAML